MAALFLLIAIIGFSQTSIPLIERMIAGKASPHFMVHLHAATMFLWLFLFLAQTILIKSNAHNTHKKLGLASLVIALVMVISMIWVDTFIFERLSLISPELQAEQYARLTERVSKRLMSHTTTFVFFTLFFIIAIRYRKKDTHVHKRMMVLAAMVLLIPANARLVGPTKFLPTLGLNFIDTRHFYMLLPLVPALVYDLINLKKIHKAYRFGLALLGIWIVLTHYLWGTQMWEEFVQSFISIMI